MSRAEELMAEMLELKDWHKLKWKERELVSLLEESGHLEKKVLPNGFVGKAIRIKK